jgi:hypothetical protein
MDISRFSQRFNIDVYDMGYIDAEFYAFSSILTNEKKDIF